MKARNKANIETRNLINRLKKVRGKKKNKSVALLESVLKARGWV